MEKSQLVKAITSLLLAGAPQALIAQDSEGVHRGGLEQVIVQARRVEENVQEVPLAITAMSGEQLEKAGVVQFFDLAQSAPAVVWAPTTARKDASAFGIRGQRSDDVLLSSDQTVAVLIGGVPMNWAYGAAISGAFDISAVEVAKGPQGTLFGKNSTGGAIIITPAEPVESVEGLVKAGIGNFNLRQLEAMYNQPLTDTLALRVAAAGTQQDGTFNNLSGGDDFSSTDNWAARISLKWQPTSELYSLLVVEDMWSSSTGAALKPIVAKPNSTTGAVYYPAYVAAQDDDFFSGRSDLPNAGYNDTKMWGVLNTTSYDITENFTVKNIIGIRDLWYEGFGDLDGVTGNMTVVPASYSPAQRAVLSNIQFNTFQATDAQSVTEELQIIGSHDIADWIAGLYYGHTDGHDGARAQQLNGIGNLAVSGPRGGLTNETIAIFGQSTWHLTDKLNLTTGLRFTKDDREVNIRSRTLANPASGQADACLMRISVRDPVTGVVSQQAPDPCNLKLTKSFHEPTWNVSLDYKIADSQLLYAATRRGYKSGGFPGRAQTPANSEPFDPEIVTDYEIGYKLETSIGGMPLRVNTAAFYQDYKDIQRNITVLQGSLLLTDVRNAAAGTIQGGEVEFTFLPFDSLELSGYLSYIDASYDNWTEINSAGVAIDRSKNKFASVPEFSGSLTARYTLPIPESLGELSAAATVYYQDETALYVDNAVDGTGAECQGAVQDSYKVYSARIDWLDPIGVGGLKVSAWGKNLANEEYYTSGLCLYNQAGITFGFPAEPRTFGLTAAYKF